MSSGCDELVLWVGWWIVTYENVVMRSPVSPKTAVHAERTLLVRLTINMMMKQSQNESPREPPREPMFRVATAMLALNLSVDIYVSRLICCEGKDNSRYVIDI